MTTITLNGKAIEVDDGELSYERVFELAEGRKPRQGEVLSIVYRFVDENGRTIHATLSPKNHPIAVDGTLIIGTAFTGNA